MYPSVVGRYHGLYPLDNPSQEKTTDLFGFYTWIFKAISGVDHLPYALWRLEGHRLTNEISHATLEFWRSIYHPNITSLREILATNEFGDSCKPQFTNLEIPYL
jgi:PAB-dependent poly(A)-specific ribonuclease subunit 3